MLGVRELTYSFGAEKCWKIVAKCREPSSEVSQRCWTLQSPSDAQELFVVLAGGSQGKTDDLGLEACAVIELGSGTGMAGILAAKILSQDGSVPRIVLTDHDTRVLQVLEENVKLNGIHACVSRLDWHDFTSFGLERAFDLALAADCLYVSRVVPSLVSTIGHVLGPDGIFLYAHAVRRTIFVDPTTRLPRLEDHDSPWEQFKEALQATGFHIQHIEFVCSRAVSSAECPLVLLAASRNANVLHIFSKIVPLGS